jgi:hypothetical protein
VAAGAATAASFTGAVVAVGACVRACTPAVGRAAIVVVVVSTGATTAGAGAAVVVVVIGAASTCATATREVDASVAAGEAATVDTPAVPTRKPKTAAATHAGNRRNQITW